MLDKLDEWMKKAVTDFSSSSEPTKKPSESSQGNKPVVKKTHAHNGNQIKRSTTPKPKGNGRTYQGSKPSNKPSNKGHSPNYKGHKPAPGKQLAPKPLSPTPITKGQVKVIPLGGLNEVGKNLTVLEFEEDIIIIDIGFQFPGEDFFGIDYIVPDVTYLERNKKRIRGVFLTHGHLDHIGGIPYILPKLDFPPVYGTRLTMGLVEDRLKEFKLEKKGKLHVIDPSQVIKAGKFTCSFIRVMHSIPDCVAIVIDTPVGKVVHTGDFKFDDNPARNMIPDEVGKLEALGKQNVLALLCESTNSQKPGHTISEQEVGKALDDVIGLAQNRIIVSSFSSQIGRIQQIIDAAVKHGRKIFVSGRSMTNNIKTTINLGYLKVPKDFIQDIKRYKPEQEPDSKTLILTTGSQGEPVAALARIARNDHPQIKAKKGDSIVFSSSPIIGNEHNINKLVNAFAMMGCHVINNQMYDIHTSGHGKQDELVRMMNLVKPKYLVPIHGEYYMRQGLQELAIKHCGIPESNIIILQNGHMAVGGNGQFAKGSDEIELKDILIDGKGEGKLDSTVLRERELMAKNGSLIVILPVSRKDKKLQRQPEVLSRGFLYLHEMDEFISEITKVAGDAYKQMRQKNPGANRRDYKKYIERAVGKYAYKQLDRDPLIIPLIVEG